MIAIQTTSTFDQWFQSLRDRQGKARIIARLRRVEMGHLGDLKSVGQGVQELRIDCGPGYRIYFTRRGLEWVVLLAGGDKNSQKQDILAAQDLARRMRG
jgi:putative addiction module killer protein